MLADRCFPAQRRLRRPQEQEGAAHREIEGAGHDRAERNRAVRYIASSSKR